MKKTVLALVLVLAMILSCVGTAFAAPYKTEIGDLETGVTETAKERKGFQSELFREVNTYQYAADEIVRAIVVLESAPEADVVENGTEKAATYRAKLQNEHATVRKAMKFDYTMKFDFTTLLNGFSCEVAYGNLDAIAAIDGVKAVYIANSYSVPELAEPQNASSNLMTGNVQLFREGYAGNGIVVAVLDTGLRTTHEAFQDYGNATPVLTEESVELATADGVYLSTKVPFAYDYADGDTDVSDMQGHGTHVAGTAVGYVEDEYGAVTMTGAAPAAQLLAMKIFSDDSGSTYSDIYFQALEDAYLLGADVINMSIGAQNGFTYDSDLEGEVFGNIYARLEEAGIIVCVAAGNEYSMNYFSSIGYTGSEYTDYGTVASPATYEGNVSVASVNNQSYPMVVFEMTLEDATNYFLYVDNSDEGLWLEAFAGQTLDYVAVTDAEGNFSLGKPEDLAAAGVEGKVAVVSRGELSFEEKVENAYNAGAIGCIVVNNTEGSFGMLIETYEIPAISCTADAATYFFEGYDLYIPEEPILLSDGTGWYMSEFSNWGTSPDLTIDPAITSVGGNVYSSVNTADDAYEVYSGTSMATPNAAGTFATMLSYLKGYAGNYDENGNWEYYDKVELAQHAKALLQSTGIVLYDADNYIYSVRKQGSGFANSDEARATYHEGAYILDPLKELGDDPEKTGVYTFDVTLCNTYDDENGDDVTYDVLDATVMYEYLYFYDETTYVNSLTTDYFYHQGADCQGNDTTVEFSVDGEAVTSVTVPIGETVTVTVTITLDDFAKAWLDNYYENGAYVEGYVFFSNEAAETHATFLAYYGDWTQAPVLEELNSFDLMEANYICNTYDADGEGNTYADYGYGAYDVLWSLYGDFYTDVNTVYALDSYNMEALTYLGANLLDMNTTEYMTEHLSFSTPESDGTWYWYDAFYITPFQLRNAEHLVMTVTDKESGEVYYVDDTMYLPKAAYDYNYGYWQNYGMFIWDGTDMDGNYVPSGTVATVTFDAMLPYEDTWQEDIWVFDVTVDSTAPELDVVYDAEAGTLNVSACDEQYLAGVYLTDTSYNEIIDFQTFSSDVVGMDASFTFDVEGLPTEVIVVAMDYASNETEIQVGLYDVGEDATVTLVSPTGVETYECKTGDYFNFPAASSTDTYEFYFWIDMPIEEPMESIYDIFYTEATMYFEGDYMTVTETETTFYAFCAKGEQKPLDKTNYYAVYEETDYTGDWAIVGLNVDENGYYDTDLPQALNNELAQLDLATAIEDIEIGDSYVEFFTNDTSITFSFEKVEGDVYTIKTKDTGKYLALGTNGLTLADTVSDAAKWIVTPDYQTACGSLAYNYAQPNMLLTYDDGEECFAVYDDTVVIYEDPSTGYVYTASDWYTLWLYKASNVTYEVEGYCTPAVYTVTWSVDGTETTELYVEGNMPEYKGSTDKADDAEYSYTFVGWTPELAPVTADVTYTAVYEKEALAVTSGICYYDNFTDCTAAWYHDAVDYTVANGLIAGISDTQFAPNGTLTRAMMVTILYRAAGSPEVSEPATFTDVPTGKWYSDAIAWAQDNGIVAGVTTTTFAPNSPVTREQIAAILWRYVGEPQVDGDLSGYKDANQISGYAKEAMEWANSEGIFVGDAGKLTPKANATRAQFARIIMVFLEGSYVCENMD